MMLTRERLAVVIILLFVTTCIIPSIAQDIEKPSVPTSKGNWWYVGGSGPGNYSRIQDAIDNASDYDSVFVYDDSSPYYENLVINKSIAMIGEGRNSTIVDGGKTGDVVFISADNVHIDGFTIQYSGTIIGCGLAVVAANDVTISNNTIFENTEGIFMNNSNSSTIVGNTFSQNHDASTMMYFCNNIVVSSNLITSGGVGIVLGQSMYTNISQNVIEYSGEGISLDFSDNTTIYHNIIRSNGDPGIQMSGTNNSVIGNTIRSNYFSGMEVTKWTQNLVVRHNVIDGNTNGLNLWGVHSNSISITLNTFSNNSYGIEFSDSSLITISCNNFIKNDHDAYFQLTPFEKNLWKENYWDDHLGIGPKIIKGRVLLFSINHGYFYLEFWIPWVNFDWHPSHEPYDITEMK
jgi:nitrous oxidase accessory protein